MKILKYVLFIIVGLAIIFFAFGLLKTEVNYGSEITANKSVEEAWAVANDDSKSTLWLDGLKSFDLISGEKGKVGSKYKVIVNPGEGQEDFEMTETIISVKENDHIEMHFDSEMMDFEQIMKFKEENGKTTITTESKVMAKGIMSRAFFAIMEMLGGTFTAQEMKNMNALKKLIDENTTEYYPSSAVTEN